jgi:DNA-binding transcriptional MerR regulator
MPLEVETERKGPAIRKLYFTIGEVSEQVGVPSHVLRYWESEFPQLRPKKGRSGNRTYQAKDLEIIQKIRILLYEQRFTIAGAKAQLAQNGTAAVAEQPTNGHLDMVDDLRRELQEILNLLDDSSGRGAAR